MPLIFYILQLLCPSQYSGMSLQAPVSPVEPTYVIGSTSVSKETYSSHKASVGCLAETLWYESRGESSRGSKLIAQVVKNRSRDKSFPNSICGVVNQKVAGQYQFSYHYNKSLRIRGTREYVRLLMIADHVLTQYVNYTTALYFKVCSKESEFFNKLQLITRHGAHCFYG
jgi:spore germination cell wall hydrolase CwlJ-like protein